MRATARRKALAGFLLLGVSFSRAAAADDISTDWSDSILESIEIFGTVELSYERQQNFDLDRADADDLDLMPVELELEVLFAPNDHFEAYVRSQLKHQFALHEEGGRDAESTELHLKEANVTLAEPDLGLSLRLGRQLFEDERQWLYDEELDAVRGAYENSDLLIELSASQDTYILYAMHQLAEDIAVGAYGFVIDDQDGGDDRTLFLDLTSTGSPVDRLTYWLDAAVVHGEEDDRRPRGYGLDLLGSYGFDAPLSPRILAGYAFGSGDPDPDDDHDRQFRQTGLQDNEAELGGIASFHYYGEAFDPELSNMSIFTAGFGVWPRRDLSIDLIYHYYLQDVASDKLADSALDAEPTGRNRRLGNEVDLVLGFKPLEKLQVNGFFGYFMPGPAFERGSDDALFARIEVEIGL